MILKRSEAQVEAGILISGDVIRAELRARVHRSEAEKETGYDVADIPGRFETSGSS